MRSGNGMVDWEDDWQEAQLDLNKKLDCGCKGRCECDRDTDE